jgi:hypothetical protein
LLTSTGNFSSSQSQNRLGSKEVRSPCPSPILLFMLSLILLHVRLLSV